MDAAYLPRIVAGVFVDDKEAIGAFVAHNGIKDTEGNSIASRLAATMRTKRNEVGFEEWRDIGMTAHNLTVNINKWLHDQDGYPESLREKTRGLLQGLQVVWIYAGTSRWQSLVGRRSVAGVPMEAPELEEGWHLFAMGRQWYTPEQLRIRENNPELAERTQAALQDALEGYGLRPACPVKWACMFNEDIGGAGYSWHDSKKYLREVKRCTDEEVSAIINRLGKRETGSKS